MTTVMAGRVEAAAMVTAGPIASMTTVMAGRVEATTMVTAGPIASMPESVTAMAENRLLPPEE
ncbi:hypothetical protein ACIBCT_26625 [Streptosporangium sp. NPDC050855]|uniref:hypothetical protein n=1 Tax=Streptosporangium sp. NPDC050855 TaxID=3366194 RepID=UPI003793D458